MSISNLTELPFEIFSHVCSYLSPKDIFELYKTSKYLKHQVSFNGHLLRAHQEFFEQIYGYLTENERKHAKAIGESTFSILSLKSIQDARTDFFQSIYLSFNNKMASLTQLPDQLNEREAKDLYVSISENKRKVNFWIEMRKGLLYWFKFTLIGQPCLRLR